MKKSQFALYVMFLLLVDCKHSPKHLPSSVNSTGTFAKGADVSWLPEMEKSGYVFKNDQGNVQDCLEILKNHGIESIRLRVWVNPSNHPQNGHNSPAKMVAMAKRVSAAGFRLMIDFHYSDSWADPGQQVKPAAWVAHSFVQLQTDVYDHTYSVMSALAREGIIPEWVQVGNEINPGMLLPDGSITDFKKLSALLNSGYDAVKKVSPTSKVIIHLANGVDNKFCRNFFDSITASGAHFDVIGLSYYPYWLKNDYTTSITALAANLNDMASRYGKEVIIAEIGGEDTKAQNTKDTILAAMDRVKAVPGGRGLGVFYWEPQGARSWSQYALSAWGHNGRPTIALDAFLATPQSRATMTDLEGSTYAFFSNQRALYVSVDTSAGGQMTAAATTVESDAERFALHKNKDGTLSFKSLVTEKFVSASSSTSILCADAVGVGEAEKFTLIERGDGFQAIRSSAIGTNWDVAEDIAIRSQWNDPTSSWQSFMVFKAN